MKINKIMEEDERHKASGCIETKARRLYMRDYTLQFDINDSGPKKKQIFIPIGIICLNCGRIIANMGERFTLKKKDWDFKIPDYPKPIPEYEDEHLSRQQRRRADRLKQEGLKQLGKVGIKKRRTVITHLD